MSALGPVTALAVDATLVLLLAALAMTFVRLWRGPSLPDRVVALDLLSVLLVAFASVVAIRSGTEAFLDVAIALALIAFLGTVAFARFAERRIAAGERGRDHEG